MEELSAGDQITASITYSGNDHFQLMIDDAAMGGSRTYNVIISNTPRTSAEWIVEAFVNGNTQQQVTLPAFQPITFSHCSASVNNVAGSITENHAQSISMTNNSGNIVARPQGLNQAGTSFSVSEVGAVPEFPNPLFVIAAIFAALIVLRRRFTRRHMRPHEALRQDSCGSCRIKIGGDNNWITVVKNAAKVQGKLKSGD